MYADAGCVCDVKPGPFLSQADQQERGPQHVVHLPPWLFLSPPSLFRFPSNKLKMEDGNILNQITSSDDRLRPCIQVIIVTDA